MTGTGGALAAVLDAGDGFGAGGAAPPSGSWSSSSRPTRPGRWSPRAGATPPTATRWRGSSTITVTRSRASTTSTTPATRSGCSASRCRRGRGGEDVPEGGYQGDYVAELAAEIPGRRRRCESKRWPRRRSSCCSRRSRRRSSATAFASTRSSASGRCTRGRRARSSARWPARAGGHVVPLRGRDVAADDERSATTRTGWSCAPTASPTYLAADIAYMREQARARVRAPAACRSGPTTRLRARAEGRDGRARRRSRTRSSRRSSSSCTWSRAARRPRCRSVAGTS